MQTTQFDAHDVRPHEKLLDHAQALVGGNLWVRHGEEPGTRKVFEAVVERHDEWLLAQVVEILRDPRLRPGLSDDQPGERNLLGVLHESYDGDAEVAQDGSWFPRQGVPTRCRRKVR